MTGLNPFNPYRMSLDARDRNELVWVHANANLYIGLRKDDYWRNSVAKLDRFMLTSLGAWIRLHFTGSLPGHAGTLPLSIEEWRDCARMGRDQSVRVVYGGYLFPFGHAASLVKVTERKFELVDGKAVACLRQHMIVIVREPVKQYPTNEQLSTTPSHGR